ncbi:MAG: L-aspartate oxidase [Polyangiales bacterium]
MRITTDYLVLGSGIAGLTFALRAAAHGEVLLVTKRGRADAATTWAQGGISAVLDPSDSFEAHAEDTLRTGAGLCKREVVDVCVSEGPAAIEELVRLGARFSRAVSPDGSSHFDLAREGGHSARRVVHAGDITGREVERALLQAVESNPRIKVLEQHMGVDLITVAPSGGPERCVGAYVLDKATGEVNTVLARATILATGGAGKVYLYTSNPDVASGDGIAMAYRAGAEVANMEFFQFHPTGLYHPQAKNFLISEALRGEGGVLRLEDGTAFMPKFHEMADLAPRDVVARAIDAEMKRTGEDCVWLDMTHHPGEFLRQRFPNIYAECLRWGVDMSEKPIPVVPAAHYCCGGVTTDTQGRSSLPGLWVIGETSCTGLHGANRLASNSLLEGVVFGRRAADCVAAEARSEPHPDVPDWNPGEAVPSDEAVVVTQNWDELRRLMWNYVGIVRTTRRLQRAQRRIALLQEEIREYYWDHLVTADTLELRNIATVAELVVACALVRKESRGLHYTTDFLATDPAQARDTVVKRGVPARLR